MPPGSSRVLREHPWFQDFAWAAFQDLSMSPPVLPRLVKPRALPQSEQLEDEGDPVLRETFNPPDKGGDGLEVLTRTESTQSLKSVEEPKEPHSLGFSPRLPRSLTDEENKLYTPVGSPRRSK